MEEQLDISQLEAEEKKLIEELDMTDFERQLIVRMSEQYEDRLAEGKGQPAEEFAFDEPFDSIEPAGYDICYDNNDYAPLPFLSDYEFERLQAMADELPQSERIPIEIVDLDSDVKGIDDADDEDDVEAEDVMEAECDDGYDQKTGDEIINEFLSDAVNDTAEEAVAAIDPHDPDNDPELMEPHQMVEDDDEGEVKADGSDSIFERIDVINRDKDDIEKPITAEPESYDVQISAAEAVVTVDGPELEELEELKAVSGNSETDWLKYRQKCIEINQCHDIEPAAVNDELPDQMIDYINIYHRYLKSEQQIEGAAEAIYSSVTGFIDMMKASIPDNEASPKRYLVMTGKSDCIDSKCNCDPEPQYTHDSLKEAIIWIADNNVGCWRIVTLEDIPEC